MGTAAPKLIVAIPVLNGKRLLAVIELATYELFKEKEQALLDALMPVVAMNIDILDRNVKTQRLLEESQRQAEGLERQAAQLEEQAIEMEAQQSLLRETTASMAEQRATMQQILDNSPVGTAFTVKGVFHYTNPEFEKMFDCRPGDSAASIYPTPEARAAMVEEIKRDGFVRNKEMTLVSSGGKSREYLVTFMPLVHEGEDGVMGWLLDISESRKVTKNIS
jgi:PAS domain-containing protein